MLFVLTILIVNVPACNRKISHYIILLASQGWGVAVLVGVPNKDDVFKTHPMNLLNERTLKGTFFGNYKPRTDLPGVVEKYMNKVKANMQNWWLFNEF